MDMKAQPRLKLSKLRDIGWALWDPIGLLPKESPVGFWSEKDNLPFADEYDRYLIQAASRLRRGVPDEDVVAYLIYIETEHMALGGVRNSRERAEQVVAAIKTETDLWVWPNEQGRFNDD